VGTDMDANKISDENSSLFGGRRGDGEKIQ